MRRFVRYGALFLLILFLLCRAVDYMVTAGLRQTELPLYAQWNAVLNGNADSEVIIMGSSRAWVGLSPGIIGDRLGMTCYNLAVNGYTLDMQLARHRLYREHNPDPKLIVVSLDTYSFNTRDGLYDNNQFLPYFNEETVEQAVKPYRYFHWYDYGLPLVRYRGKMSLIWKGAAELVKVRHYVDTSDRGHEPQDLTWSDEFARFVEAHPNGYEQIWKQSMVDEFSRFLAECRGDGTAVVLVYPPEYSGARDLLNNRDEIFAIYHGLAAEHGVHFLDYSYDPMASDTKYFYNSQHLNRTGSELFSAKLADDLAPLLESAGGLDG